MLKGLRGIFKGRNKGFTLIELLIVVAILGVLTAIVVPSVAHFIGTGNVEAANIEASTIRVAVAAYITEHDGAIPPETSNLSDYLQGSLKGSYDIDENNGTIIGTGGWQRLIWVDGKWEKE